MQKFPWLTVGLAVLSLAFSVHSAFAERIPVSILYRQDSDVAYHAVIPGYSGPNADITGACLLDPDPANCPDPTQDSVNGVPLYTLVGTTLSLGLPDGRIALVNCVSSHSPYGNYINRHNCGMPLSQHAEAEFTGETAKLVWPVGPNGHKTESQTYKVIALLPKPPVPDTSNDESKGSAPPIPGN